MRTLTLSHGFSRLWHRLRDKGLRTTVDDVIWRVRIRLYLDEIHHWYELPLGTDRPRIGLMSGLELIRAGEKDLPLLNELPTMSEHAARRRMEAGNDLWLVLKGSQPVFACWIFHRSVPVTATRGGFLALPPDTVCMEDSVTSPAYLGRAIAFGAWSKIADSLEQTGTRSIITKTEEDLMAARRAFVRCGFREIASMRFRRVAPKERLVVRAGSSPTADWIAQQLMR